MMNAAEEREFQEVIGLQFTPLLLGIVIYTRM
jgi:hypothetical protein